MAGHVSQPVVVCSLSCRAESASSTWRPCRSRYCEDRSFLRQSREGGEKEEGDRVRGTQDTGGKRGMNTIRFSAQDRATHWSCRMRSAALLLASFIISVCEWPCRREGGREGGR